MLKLAIKTWGISASILSTPCTCVSSLLRRKPLDHAAQKRKKCALIDFASEISLGTQQKISGLRNIFRKWNLIFFYLKLCFVEICIFFIIESLLKWANPKAIYIISKNRGFRKKSVLRKLATKEKKSSQRSKAPYLTQIQCNKLDLNTVISFTEKNTVLWLNTKKK